MDKININNPTPEIGPYTKLTPFRFWCQKVLPLVYDESLSYYELLCKVVDYLNKTMEDVDNMIDDMGDFRDAYADFTDQVKDAVEGLESFVNNYFDNLDVQEEINNKLDAMAEDGYFDTLFTTLFTDDIITEAGNVTSAWIAENLLQETGYVIDNSLTVANAAADAKAAGDRITVLESDIIDRSESTSGATDGYYVNSENGGVSANVNFSYITFDVMEGDTIQYKTQRSESNIGIAFYNRYDTYISGVATDGTEKEIVVPANAYIARATYRTAQISNFYVKIIKKATILPTNYNKLKKAIPENIGALETNAYNIFHKTELKLKSYLNGYNISTFLPIIATGNSYFTSLFSIENLNKIRIPAPSTAIDHNYIIAYTENVKAINTTYAQLVNSTSAMLKYVTIDTLTSETIIDTALLKQDGYNDIAIEGWTSDVNGFYIIADKVSLNWAAVVLPENGEEKPYATLNMFENIQCLGDSYTLGGIRLTNSWGQAKKPYPAIIADSLGVDVDNFGVSGATIKSYVNDNINTVLAASAPDLYIISFGINDAIQEDTIGTVADINDLDYTQNANTFYGNYGKLIAQLKIHAPLARFMIFGQWHWTTAQYNYSDYSEAAKGVAEHFNIPYVEPFDDVFFNSDFYHDTMISGHPTPASYSGMAYAIMRLANKAIEDNQSYYKYAGLE